MASTMPAQAPPEPREAPPAPEKVPTKPLLPSKRAFDIAGATLGLLLSAPLWLLIALAIKLEDGGPVFYAQDRVGKGGELFRSWKFRSMVPEEDNPHGPERQADPDDPRITTVGRVIRPTALDELPQLWSILIGDMSFVGPRAMLPEEENSQKGEVFQLHEVEGYELRHSVLPGLTGVAQVYGRRDLPPRHKFRYDLVYVENRSIWLDLRLFFLSVWISLRGRWPSVGYEDE